MIPKIKPSMNGGRTFDKLLACYYCEKILKYRIGNHLVCCHANEEEVQDIFKCSKQDTKAKRQAIEKIKHMGNFNHNIKVLKNGKGELIVARRSRKDSNVKDYLPCTHCLGFFRSCELFRHNKSCSFNKKKDQSHDRVIVKGRMLLAGALDENMSEEYDKVVLASMRSNDDVCEAIENDNLIRRFGKVLLNKLGSRRKHCISQRLRQLGRLKCQLGMSSTTQITTVITGAGFDTVCEGVRGLCGHSENEQNIKVFETPSLALRLGHSLSKLATLKRGMAIRAHDKETKKDADVFIQLYEEEWEDEISSTALATLKTNHFNKNELLPLTSDVVLLKTYLEDQMSELTEKLERGENNMTDTFTMWRRLSEVTLAHTSMFNKRRASEVAELRVSSYKERPNWNMQINQEVIKTLDEVEKKLLER